MEEYSMKNSNDIWQWSRDRKKLFKMSKIHSMADGFSSVAKMGSLADGSSPNIILKGKQCIDDSPLRRSPATENSLKSRAFCRDMCLPIQNSIEEVGPFENGDSTKSPVSVIRRHVSSSGFKSDHPHGDSGHGGPHRLNVNEEMRDLRHVACCETSSNYINWPGHPPARKKPKRNQSLVSETSTSPFEIENQKTKSEFLFPGLHLLADVAVRILENDVADFPENSLTEENGIRKAIFIPTGVPFWQKRVPRRAKSAFKHRQVLHDLEKSPSAAKSEPNNICKLGDPECIKQIENEVVGNGVRRSKRTQALPSKYRDCVLQPWKRGTGR